MEDNKNLVKEFLLEEKIIDPDKFMYSYFYEDVEWIAYKLSNDTMAYVSYELTIHGLGYAFCVTVKCTRFSYNIGPKFYTKSFSNTSEGEWSDMSDELRNKMLSNATRDLQVWGNQQ